MRYVLASYVLALFFSANVLADVPPWDPDPPPPIEVCETHPDGEGGFIRICY